MPKIGRRKDALGALVLNNEATELLVNSAGELVVAAHNVTTGGLTDTQLRASPVPVSGAFFQATQPVSLATGIDVIDRAARLLGHVTVDNASLAVTGPLTDAQLRASAVPVDTELPAAAALADAAANPTAPAVGGFGMLWNGATWDRVPGSAASGMKVQGTVTAISATAANLKALVDQGAAAAIGGAWPAKLTDGTSTQAVKAASTAAVATDQAAVVAISPNNTVPVSLASVPSHAVTNAGTFAVQADTELAAAAALADATANPTIPSVGGMLHVFNGTTWDRARGDTTAGLRATPAPASLVISATAAVSTGATATLPAAAALFHYITAIHISQVSSTTAGAPGAPLVVTTTNLPGSLAWTRPTLVAGGGAVDLIMDFPSPLKSSVVNTATTIVAPVHTNIIWRIDVFYYTAP